MPDIQQDAREMADSLRADFEEHRAPAMYFAKPYPTAQEAKQFLAEFEACGLEMDMNDSDVRVNVNPFSGQEDYIARATVVRKPDYADDDVQAWRDKDGWWTAIPKMTRVDESTWRVKYPITTEELEGRLRRFETEGKP